MSKRLAWLCGSILAVTMAAPASAQIVLGGDTVVTSSGEAAPLPLTFPLDPDQADYKKITVATPAFSGATEAEIELAAKVAGVIQADLSSVGLFGAPDATVISTFRTDIGALPIWSEWASIGTGAVLLGKTVIGEDNSVSVQFRLYDVLARKQIVGTQYRMPADQWRRAAHKVADDVIVALVGGKGGFDSRIVYAAESGGKTRLGIVDQDGANAGNVIESVQGLESPRFSPATQTIVYSADAPVPGKPTQAQRTTILYDMQGGTRAPLTTGAQANADARYSADGVSLIYSRKAGANTDIYLMALSTRKETKLTDDKAADVEPALSPDGKKYVFVSERAGASQVFLANVDGSTLPCADGVEAKACAITKEGGGYATPVWSPDGGLIAFTRRTGAKSALHVIRPDGTVARALTTPSADALDLHPSWSPEGRRIAFSRVMGQRSHIAVVNLAGGEPVRLEAQGDAYEPDWGPKLP
jgi:TolB protein